MLAEVWCAAARCLAHANCCDKSDAGGRGSPKRRIQNTANYIGANFIGTVKGQQARAWLQRSLSALAPAAHRNSVATNGVQLLSSIDRRLWDLAHRNAVA